MMVLISYDVSTVSASGRTRLRKVAKECQNHAQRVQNSVFEADLDYSSFLKLKDRLIKLINLERRQSGLLSEIIGKNELKHIGAKKTYNPEGVIII